MLKIVGNKTKIIDYLIHTEEDKTYELTEYQEKRNLNQNAMYWKLLNELALAMKMSIEQVHKQMLRDYSVRYEILVPDDYELRGIEYYDKKGSITKNGKKFNVYYIYTPSHELNKEEFSNLLNGVIQECENVGVNI